jgi:hypothetical protein
MKKRFSDEQIISILREAEAGVPARELWNNQYHFRCHRFTGWSCRKLSA